MRRLGQARPGMPGRLVGHRIGIEIPMLDRSHKINLGVTKFRAQARRIFVTALELGALNGLPPCLPYVADTPSLGIRWFARFKKRCKRSVRHTGLSRVTGGRNGPHSERFLAARLPIPLLDDRNAALVCLNDIPNLLENREGGAAPPEPAAQASASARASASPHHSTAGFSELGRSWVEDASNRRCDGPRVLACRKYTFAKSALDGVSERSVRISIRQVGMQLINAFALAGTAVAVQPTGDGRMRPHLLLICTFDFNEATSCFGQSNPLKPAELQYLGNLSSVDSGRNCPHHSEKLHSIKVMNSHLVWQNSFDLLWPRGREFGASYPDTGRDVSHRLSARSHPIFEYGMHLT